MLDTPLSEPAAKSRRRAAKARKSVLFLAQTPPPHHGQSAIAALVRDVFDKDAEMVIDQRWSGGAQANTDIGHRTFGKYFGFARLVLELIALIATGRRYDIAYLGIAPWAHTALRDVLLTGLAKRLAKRTWMHVHGNGLSALTSRPGMLGWMVRRLLAGAEVIAITREVGEEAAESGLFSRILPLPNMAADPGDAAPARTGTLTIACLGNLDPRKGVLDFVDVTSEIAAKDSRIRAIIIGGETAQLGVDDVKARAASQGTAHRIRVTGWISEERKTAELAQADIFLYLSRHDLAPVALIEALAHGCAPIVLDIGGLSEMVGPELQANVITMAGGDAALAVARARIEAYLDDPEALERDKARARRRYLDAYSPATFRDGILRFLATGEAAGGGEADGVHTALADQTS